jgi:hypothetical protein
LDKNNLRKIIFIEKRRKMRNILINLDGEDYSFDVPTGWNEVSVKNAARLTAVEKENRTEIEIVADIISILSGIDIEIIYMLTSEQFNEIVEVIKFTTEKVDGELVDSVIIDDEEYFLKKDFTQLTMGEIISIETILGQNNNNIAPAMAKLLCIFLRKKKENGHLESFKKSFMERESKFENVIITEVNNLFLFFLDGNNSSHKNTKDYLENQNQKVENEIDLQN